MDDPHKVGFNGVDIDPGVLITDCGFSGRSFRRTRSAEEKEAVQCGWRLSLSGISWTSGPDAILPAPEIGRRT